MSARLLLAGVLASAAVRRKGRDNGAIFAVAGVRDTDRGAERDWRVFVNDPALIERIEEMRAGEPIAISGPFYFSVEGGEPVYRITAEALLDTKRRRKPKGLIGREQRVESDEMGLAPASTVEEALNDDVPF
jgi:hypothetical protein